MRNLMSRMNVFKLFAVICCGFIIPACIFMVMVVLSLFVPASKHQVPLLSEVKPPLKPLARNECLGRNGTRLVSIKQGIDCILENQTIFFVETRPGFKSFNGRRLCAFESTAMNNPRTTIVIVISQDVDLPQENIDFLQALPNLYLTKMNYTYEIQSTPLGHILNEIKKTKKWKDLNLSNILRLLILSKYGGAYMDTDVVSLTALPNDLKNFVVKDVKPEKDVNNGVMHFEKNNPFLHFLLETLAQKRKSSLELSKRGSIGVLFLREVKDKFCLYPNTTLDDTRISYVCPGGLSVLEKRLAHRWDTFEYADPAKLHFTDLLDGIRDSFVVHYFGSKFDGGRLDLRREAPLVKIMEAKCPTAVKIVKNEIRNKQTKLRV